MSRIRVRRALGTALIAVTLVALSGCGGTSNNSSTASSHKPSKSPSPTMSSTPSSPTASPQTMNLPVYYVADQPRGPRLFREFRQLQVSTNKYTAALNSALSNLPLDPDYRTDWPAGTAVTSAQPPTDAGGHIVVDLTNSGTDLTARPSGMTAAQAKLALQQLVYTADAVAQQQSPLNLSIDGTPAHQVLGIPVPSAITADDPMKVQGTVWIIDPQDGDHVGATFTVKGRGAFFEATVPWQLLQGTAVAKQGVAMAQECCKLSPFSFTVHNVRPGDYTLRVYDADQSGVEEGKNEPSDTKRITVG